MIDIDKNYLYDLYFNKNLTKNKICKIINCSEKVIEKRFKMWGWKFKSAGKLVGEFMQKRSKLIPYVEKIKKMYIEEKKTCKEIGNLFGVSETAVSRFLKKNKVILRKLQDAQVKRLVIDKDKIYDLYVLQNKNCSEIAKMFNSSDEVVRKILGRYNVERRNKCESFKGLVGARKILKEGSDEEITELKEKISKSKRKHFEQDIDNKIVGKKLIRISKIDKDNKVLLKCLNDGLEWKVSVSHIMEGRGCPQCRFKNQKETFVILHNLLCDIKIKTNYLLTTYEWDNKERRLYIDFFFEYNDKKIVIEYNGEQHYKPVKFNGMKEELANNNFDRQKIRDQVLRDYCKDNDIILIEIDGREYNIYQNNIKEYITTNLRGII